MFFSKPHQELEEYFAKRYTKKYIEFGGYFHISPYRFNAKSPMQKYFSSGKYKELHDINLDKLWVAVRWREYHWNIGIILIIVIVIISGLYK